ncbi:general secretion pathway protein GspN [Cognatiluteimonas profundi]|uniref:general secretion pathway protein GspN n=1 Tax=Cognatiluteimonas profundi TaxID=2594501 RepID=UPI00131BC36E|nr:general secretion pathway protein GspN [Lysobacter profundi]
MRVEGIAARTWVLATVAGWALLLWVLALLGMGGQVRLLPDDASLQGRLPQLAPAPPERLGPLTQYAEIGTRPLFSEDRRPQPFSLTPEGDEAAAPAFDFVLTSVLLTPVLRMAIVQPSAGGESIRIKLGEAAESQPSWRLTELNPRSAVFEGPDGRKSLDLRVFDGTGGEPPTAVGSADQPEAGSRAPASTKPAVTRPASPPTATPSPQAPETPEATPEATPDAAPNADAQMESIRKRIEERRAQLRQEAQPPAAPAKNP